MLAKKCGWEIRLKNDLCCVEWDMKPQVSQSIFLTGQLILEIKKLVYFTYLLTSPICTKFGIRAGVADEITSATFFGNQLRDVFSLVLRTLFLQCYDMTLLVGSFDP